MNESLFPSEPQHYKLPSYNDICWSISGWLTLCFPYSVGSLLLELQGQHGDGAPCTTRLVPWFAIPNASRDMKLLTPVQIKMRWMRPGPGIKTSTSPNYQKAILLMPDPAVQVDST